MSGAPAYLDGLMLAAWQAGQQQGDLHLVELGVLLALARHSNELGRSWPSIKVLAKELNIKYQYAAGALQSLERRGLISTSKNAQGLTVYQLLCLPPKRQTAPRTRGALSKLLLGEGPAPDRENSILKILRQNRLKTEGEEAPQPEPETQQRPALRLVSGGAS